MDLSHLPIIKLPGSDRWEEGYRFGEQLDAQYPHQDAHDLASACAHNSYGPLPGHHVTDLELLRRGECDESDWAWLITLDDGARWVAVGGCDYTGWDCQSALHWYEQKSF